MSLLPFSGPVIPTPVPISKGGTGSSTQNFVDLSSTQTKNGGLTLNTVAGTYGLTVQGGNALIQDAATATKAYRFRTNGGAMDFETGGNYLMISTWQNANFTGSQYNQIKLNNDGSDMNLERGASIAGNFYADTNGTRTNGTPSLYWSNLFATTLNLNSTASLSGGTAGQITVTGNIVPYADDAVTWGAPSFHINQIYVKYQTIQDGGNFVLGTTTGTKIGTATTQKLGFFNSTPVVQPSAVGTATGYTAGSTAATFHSDDTYTGNTGTTAYTLNGIVAALKNLGLLAA